MSSHDHLDLRMYTELTQKFQHLSEKIAQIHSQFAALTQSMSGASLASESCPRLQDESVLSTFQRAINAIHSPALGKHALTYLDDVVAYSKSFKEHLIHLDEMLDLLAQASLDLKWLNASLLPILSSFWAS